MKSLTRYAWLNAFLRARMSERLGESSLAALARAADLGEVASLLRDTEYRPLAAAIDEDAPLWRLEKVLAEIDIGRHRAVLRHAGAGVAPLVFSLMEVYDLGKVEAILRLWSEKAWEERGGIIAEKICWEIPVEKMLQAASIEEIILLLEETPYRKPLVGAYERYRRTRRLFYLESALEADYYRRLWKTVEGLGGADRATAERIIGTEVDIRNVEFLLRLASYTDLPAAEARLSLLPGGFRLGDELLLRAYASKDAGALLRALPLSLPPFPSPLRGTREALEQMRLLAAALEEARAEEARRALAGFPFTIGTVIACLSLARAESRRVRRVLVGKGLGIDAERILGAAG